MHLLAEEPACLGDVDVVILACVSASLRPSSRWFVLRYLPAWRSCSSTLGDTQDPAGQSLALPARNRRCATQAPVPLLWPDCPMCRGRLAVLSKTPSHLLLPAPKGWTPAYGAGESGVLVASCRSGNCSCGLACTACALLSCSSSEARFSRWNNWRWLKK